MALAIGIDLGSANTCTAVFREGGTEIIPHDGCPSMPSVVAFTTTGRLVGRAAKSQASLNPRNTVFDVLQLVGRKFTDFEVMQMVKKVPYIIRERRGRIEIEVEYMGVSRTLAPELIIAMILGRARDDAQIYLGRKVEHAVILIPPYFNLIQRQSIHDAAKICGLNALRLIAASTAAATEFSLINYPEPALTLLIVDIGACATCVTLAIIEQGVTEVKSTAFAPDIGGRAFDGRILHHLVEDFKRRSKLDPTVNLRSMIRLRKAAEDAKHDLSTRRETLIEVDTLYKDTDFRTSLTRSRFEELTNDLFREIMVPIEKALRDAKIEKTSIATICVAGGSARIPKIQELLSSFFNGKEISKSLNFDETQACGAAIQAAILSGYNPAGANGHGIKSKRLFETLLCDVASISLGIEQPGGIMDHLIRRTHDIPTKKSEMYSTLVDNQEYFELSVYEGERSRTKYNLLLGRYTLGPLHPSPRGVFKIGVTFELDANHCLTVSAREQGSSLHISRLVRPRECFTADEIDIMTSEAGEYMADEKKENDRLAASTSLEEYIYSSLSKHPDEQSQRVLETATEWLASNSLGRKEEYIRYAARLKSILELVQEARKELASKASKEPLESPASTHTIPIRAEVSISAQNDTHIELEEAIKIPELPASINLITPAAASLVSEPASINPISPSPPSTLFDSTVTFPDTRERSQFQDTSTHGSDAKPLQQQGSGLSAFFSASRSEGELSLPYKDYELLQISTYLRSIQQVTWASVRRLYTVLRLIGQLNALEPLIELGVSDIWFPFDSTSLPDILTASARADFLKRQSMVLSKSLIFEKNPDRTHYHFARDEPLPFRVVGRLGFGAGGHVDKVISHISHREYARKQLRKPRGVDRKDIQSFLTELQVLKRINHQHCVELVQSYTDARYFALLMLPVADCNLFEYYTQARTSPDKLSLLRSFFGCLANGLCYLHDIKVRHRDIKPQNILVQEDRVLFTDFGIALDWENLSRATTIADSGKTWHYAAPEVALHRRRNTASDVWSLGCVFLEMLTVLKGETVEAMRELFKSNHDSYRVYENLDMVPIWLDKLKQNGGTKDDVPADWILRMLKQEQGERPSAAKIANDIISVSVKQQVMFCGPCCKDGEQHSSSDDADDGEEDEWTIQGVTSLDYTM